MEELEAYLNKEIRTYGWMRDSAKKCGSESVSEFCSGKIEAFAEILVFLKIKEVNKVEPKNWSDEKERV